ncbi:MAG: hypothetical protein H6605_05800 [Flavobacteriales bacterium]|nr:hypothetical protein [Flavobacteriales bacterium]
METISFNKFITRCIFILSLAILVSCKKDLSSNLSKLVVLKDKNFVVSSIQQDHQGNIYCIGKKYSENSTYILKYDENLGLLKIDCLDSLVKDLGKVRLELLDNGNWLLTNIVQVVPESYLKIYILDNSFKVLNEKKLMSIPSDGINTLGRVNIYAQDELSNGDFLISCDTTGWKEESPGVWTAYGGICLFKLKRDLNLACPKFFGEKDVPGRSSYTYWEMNALELNDESIFFSFNAAFSVIHSGIIEKDGKLRIQNKRKQDFNLPVTNGISLMDNSILLNTSVNNTYIQGYTLIDPATGLIQSEEFLPIHIVNDGLLGPNKLSGKIDQNSGQLLFSEDRNKLFFYKIDASSRPEYKFEIPLPEYEKLLSYRQFVDKNGNIYAGVSYLINGNAEFNFRKIDINGTMLN